MFCASLSAGPLSCTALAGTVTAGPAAGVVSASAARGERDGRRLERHRRLFVEQRLVHRLGWDGDLWLLWIRWNHLKLHHLVTDER